MGLYLLLCVLYWAWSGLQLVAELRDVLDVKYFINNKLGISDRQVGGHRLNQEHVLMACRHVGAGVSGQGIVRASTLQQLLHRELETWAVTLPRLHSWQPTAASLVARCCGNQHPPFCC